MPLWIGFTWNCPHCRAVNAEIREICRICGYDSNAGEFPYYNPMPPYQGRGDIVQSVASPLIDKADPDTT